MLLPRPQARRLIVGFASRVSLAGWALNLFITCGILVMAFVLELAGRLAHHFHSPPGFRMQR
jgi:hypothetical protein